MNAFLFLFLVFDAVSIRRSDVLVPVRGGICSMHIPYRRRRGNAQLTLECIRTFGESIAVPTAGTVSFVDSLIDPNTRTRKI